MTTQETNLSFHVFSTFIGKETFSFLLEYIQVLVFYKNILINIALIQELQIISTKEVFQHAFSFALPDTLLQKESIHVTKNCCIPQ